MTIALTLPELPDESTAATADLAERCRELYVAALLVYLKDARRALNGKRGTDSGTLDDAQEALDDLTSVAMPMLRRLCQPLELDPETVADWFLSELDGVKRH